MDKSFMDYKSITISECDYVLSSLNEKEVEQFLHSVEKANRVFFIGVGRVLLSLKSIAKRFNHIGIEASIVGDINEPAITEDDILIVGSGSGNTLIPNAIAKKANSLGAKVVWLGSNPGGNLGEYADLKVEFLTDAKYKNTKFKSQQAMSSLFEQSLLLFGDICSKIIIERNEINIDGLWGVHANLE